MNLRYHQTSAAGKSGALCTQTTTWGSAPNPALAVRQTPGLLKPCPGTAGSVIPFQPVKGLSRHKRERHFVHRPSIRHYAARIDSTFP